MHNLVWPPNSTIHKRLDRSCIAMRPSHGYKKYEQLNNCAMENSEDIHSDLFFFHLFYVSQSLFDNLINLEEIHSKTENTYTCTQG